MITETQAKVMRSLPQPAAEVFWKTRRALLDRNLVRQTREGEIVLSQKGQRALEEFAQEEARWLRHRQQVAEREAARSAT